MCTSTKKTIVYASGKLYIFIMSFILPDKLDKKSLFSLHQIQYKVSEKKNKTMINVYVCF